MLTLQVRLTKELVKKAQELVDRGIYSNKSEVVRDALRRLVFQENIGTTTEKRFTVLFSADLHGNLTQFNKLFSKAFDDKVEALIIGGDIAPEDPGNRTVKDQRHFLENRLIPMIKQFNHGNSKRNHPCQVYLMMGNDDFKSNQIILKKCEKSAGFVLIHNRRVKLHEDFRIIGYPYVPLTPFAYKDWEKLDLADEMEDAKERYFTIEGKRMKKDVLVDFRFDLKKRDDTIERDLRSLFAHIDSKKVVLVSHAPPYNTALDLTGRGEHVGSAAIRRLIEEKQLAVTLHGHIHETVEVSGNFKERMGETTCLGVGNDNRSSALAIIIFNLYKPGEARREVI